MNKLTLCVLGALFWFSTSAFALDGKYCHERGADLSVLNFEFNESEGTVKEYVPVDSAEGFFTLKDSVLNIIGFWAFEENLGLPEDFVDRFVIVSEYKGTVVLTRTHNRDMIPGGPEGKSQVYLLEKCD